MQVIELGIGNWTVYAVCSNETTCALLDFISTLDAKRRNKVLADLQQYVPHSQPADWVRADFSWKLRGTDFILEFRWPTRGGGTPRVYWFYDDGRVIVCSHGDNKKGATNEEDIRAAERTRADYLAAKKRGTLSVTRYIDFISCASDDSGAD